MVLALLKQQFFTKIKNKTKQKTKQNKAKNKTKQNKTKAKQTKQNMHSKYD
jgi:hypothetical protein